MKAISLRAVVVGACLTAAISVVSPYAALLYKGSELTSNAIPLIAVVFLFGLAAAAVPSLRAISPRLP